MYSRSGNQHLIDHENDNPPPPSSKDFARGALKGATATGSTYTALRLALLIPASMLSPGFVLPLLLVTGLGAAVGGYKSYMQRNNAFFISMEARDNARHAAAMAKIDKMMKPSKPIASCAPGRC